MLDGFDELAVEGPGWEVTSALYAPVKVPQEAWDEQGTESEAEADLATAGRDSRWIGRGT